MKHEEQLRWDFGNLESLKYDYVHDRTVRTSLFGRTTEAKAHREAKFEIDATSTDTATLSICDILDSGKVAGDKIEKPLDVTKYPCMKFGPDGRILDVIYPRTTIFCLVFCPPLNDLRPGESSEREYEVPMKSGFRRIPISGTALTAWEADEEFGSHQCSVLSTELRFAERSGSSFFAPRPTRFSGKTLYRFDREQGRVVMGVVETELEQTIWMSRVRETFRMTMKLVE